MVGWGWGVFAGLKGGLRKQKDRVRKWKEHRDTQEECGVGTGTRARGKAFTQVEGHAQPSYLRTLASILTCWTLHEPTNPSVLQSTPEFLLTSLQGHRASKSTARLPAQAS